MRAIGTAECFLGRQSREDRGHTLHAFGKTHVVVPFVLGGIGLHTPGDRVTFGEVGIFQLPVRVHRPVHLEVAANPVKEKVPRLAFHGFHAVMHHGDAHTLFRQLFQLVEVLVGGMAGAAITIDDNGVGAVEHGGIFWPVVGVHLGDEFIAISLIHPLLQQGAACLEGVLPITMAAGTGYENQLLFAPRTVLGRHHGW